MVTFQKHIRYAGDAARSPLTSASLIFRLPVFEYSGTTARTSGGTTESLNALRREAAIEESAATAADFTRQEVGAVEATLLQTLTDKSYRVEFDDAALAGGDDKQRALALQYYGRAVLEGRLDHLLTTATVRYRTEDGLDLGGESIEFLAVPQASADARRLEFTPMNRTAYLALRKSLVATSLKGSDALILQALVLFGRRATGSEIPEDIAAEFAEWLERKARGSDSEALLKTFRKFYEPLHDFELTIPEIRTVTVAGRLTLDVATGGNVSAEDFRDVEVIADCSFDNAPPRRLSQRFTTSTGITGATATFDLTAAARLYRSGLVAVVVRARSLGADAWSQEYTPDDTRLGTLDIHIPKPKRQELTPQPTSVREPVAKKLRGRVLTLRQECPLDEALVLIQAKTADDAPWKTVGAATTDASGNFTLPYPYGRYTQARALVSLAPREPAEIATIADERESLSDDFLYLLLANPECQPHADEEDCDCHGGHPPKRLPDHSDLIGSEEYSQDIGGGCVNLSKPNRTISEYNFQAIVRTTDPDVANYTLTRIEVGLDAIDVSLAVALSNTASELRGFANSARAAAEQMHANVLNVWSGKGLTAMSNLIPHATVIANSLTSGTVPITASVLATSLHHLDAITAILGGRRQEIIIDDMGVFPPEAVSTEAAAARLRTLITLAIDTMGTFARYELTGGANVRQRQPVSLNNPVAWEDTPETVEAYRQGTSATANNRKAEMPSSLKKKLFGDVQAPPPDATFAQAVSVATGHILHYKAQFKSDGYSLGDLLYSLPLAPGQKKQIVVFDSGRTLVGAETQSLAQNERLAMGLINERDITSQLAGRLSESLRGSSSANTSGISAGFGTGGQGYGGTGAYGGSGSAVIGIAGGAANANSTASSDGSRDVSQFFGEKLRQSIMQNAEGYRQLNASVVTSVQEGQRYGVTAEVVANHNHCHALTMMYFEVLRHYAIFQELSSVEECVFVPLLLTRFTTENVGRWRDVLAPALLPMPSETYLQPSDSTNAVRPHPLLKAFDADQRIHSNYANVDMPAGSYDDERIQFIRGNLRLRVSLPRPRTRFDRILSLPVTTQTLTSRELDPEATARAALEFPRKMAEYATKTALTAGLNNLFGDRPPDPPGLQYKTIEKEILVREAIFDTFMKLDANYQSVPPAQCVRIVNFTPPPRISIGPFGNLEVLSTSAEDFFAENADDRRQWQAYATLLGYPDVLTMLNAHFRGNLISEWDTIFQADIAPLVFEKILQAITLQHFRVDFASDERYRGGERLLRVNLAGTTSKKRNELPQVLNLDVSMNSSLQALKPYITLNAEDLTITYATSHYNGTLFSGSLRDDLLDGTQLFIPENSEEKRNPRREDRYLAGKLIEHLNSNLEYYNKVLWYNLDPDRRYMLLDGFTIQVYDDAGVPIAGAAGQRSLASVVKNEVVAVAGNSLVLPVAPGYRVSGSLIRVVDGEDSPITLLDHYKPITPVEPYRISVPSRGVFAEAVQGSCNACEKIETDRLQDWNRFPNTDEPTPISPVVAPTPTVTDWRAAFRDFTPPLVNIQNAPATPAAGEGLQGLSALLGNSNAFRDITGLEGNQQNVIRTYLSNQENAKAFAEMAKEMAMQQHNTQNSGRIMDGIKSAKDDGAINQQEYGKLVKDHLQQQIDGGKTRPPAITAGDSKLAAVTADAVRTGTPIEASQTFPDGTIATIKQNVAEGGTPFNYTVPHVTALQQPSPTTCWAAVSAMMRAWKEATTGTITVASEIAALGEPYVTMLANDQGLTAAQKKPLLDKLGLIVDQSGLASSMPERYLQLLKQYGPLWITVDGDLTANTSPHAKIIEGIFGDGQPATTKLRIINPTNGARSDMEFLDFMNEYTQLAQAGNAGNTVALLGQIVRFASLAGTDVEGASPTTAFDTLTRLARQASMGLQANRFAKLIPVPVGTTPYTFEHAFPGGWKGTTVVDTNGLESSGLRFPIEHEMNGSRMTMPFTVLDRLSWDNARVTFGTNTFALPLSRQFLLAVDGGNSALTMEEDDSEIFPLEATIQSHSTLLFGFVVDLGNGSVVPLDLTNAPAQDVESWLRNGGTTQAVSNNRRIVLALYDLSLHHPAGDYQPKAPAPKGAANTARLYPLLSLWCANDCETAAADFTVTRPASSAMTTDMMPGAPISGHFFTDANEPIRKLWDDVTPFMKTVINAPTTNPVIALIQAAVSGGMQLFAPSPRWNGLFAHYRFGANLPETVVVDRSKLVRTRRDVREVMKTAATAYELTEVMKLPGQGAFDNVHIAPEMNYQDTAAVMAPVCQHDCLHMHWRWSLDFPDKPVTGWSGGRPYAARGAPMIPENQNLSVAMNGSTFRYLPTATGVEAMKWQIFQHHGMAYITDMSPFGQALPYLLEVNSLADLGTASWEKLYYHNRYWESLGADRTADRPRIKEKDAAGGSALGPLESM